jgi:hypothetical protein
VLTADEAGGVAFVSKPTFGADGFAVRTEYWYFGAADEGCGRSLVEYWSFSL